MPIQTEQGPKLTYEDYARIPEDLLRHEIIDGVHVYRPAESPKHQTVVGHLLHALHPAKESGRASVILTYVDVQLTEFDIVQPDVIAVSRENAHILGEIKIDGSPDLAVEVVSPTTARIDRGAKRALYESVGVPEYWIVDESDRTVCQLTLESGWYREVVHREGEVASTAFPGISVSLAEIFGWPLPPLREA